jgi:D-alanyl-D-alanine endopeptidase (penicillin-binding protein 7)
MRLKCLATTLFFFSTGALALSVDESSSPATQAGSTTTSKQSVVDIRSWEKSRRAAPRAKAEPRVKTRAGSLRLGSASALVIDQTDGSLVYAKNIDAQQPIASITKLMTAMVVLDANQSLDERLMITEEDIDRIKHSVSRLKVGSILTRFELLQLALMSSENRAASALGRNYPGGSQEFVAAMNAKAREIGMTRSRFADASGLSELNVSNAADLAQLVNAAYGYDLIRQVSTAPSYVVATGKYRPTIFRNTNALVKSKNWEIGLSKTGFIREAGHCLVMQTQIATRNLIIVLLDSRGKMTRIGDANRIKKWLEKNVGAQQRHS